MATLESMRMGYSVVFFLFLASMFPVQVSSQEGPQTTYICEDEYGTIQCTKPGIINIMSASYGARDYTAHCGGVCFPFLGFPGCDCSSDVTARVQELCDGKSTCEVRSHHDEFGDPCKNRRKLLTLTYNCSHVYATTVITTTERTAQPSTSTTTAVATVAFTTDGPPKITGTTLEVHTTLRGDSYAQHGGASQDNTVIIAAASAGVAAVILIAGVAGFIFWKIRKRSDSTDSPTSVPNNIYDVVDDVTTRSNIQLTNTGATYRTDGDYTALANIEHVYTKPTNVAQLYANL